MLKQNLWAVAAALPSILFCSLADAQPVPVTKTNPMKVYMHYMPWFDAPANPGGNWGLHWTMANRDPNVVDSTGKRQIASHFYPMIGPYESSDPKVIEYHFLLMKYAGVDGILMNWYGVQGTNGDVGALLTNSNAIVDKTDDFGMNFGVVLEDRFSANIDQAKANVRYLRDNYYNKPEYIRSAANQDPLTLVFGPITFQQPSQWTQILAEAGEDVEFLPLWYESNDAGTNADGEYAWIYQDANTTNHLNHTRNFYVSRASTLDTAGGAAYPGFDDFYQEGGWGAGYFHIPSDNGETLADTLDLATAYSSRIDFLQLATWNDFGEGTMFEPTVETGFDYLRQVQEYTGVSYDETELKLVYRLYVARTKYAALPAVQNALDLVSDHLVALEVNDALDLLNQVAPLGDYDADGDVDAADYQTLQAAFGKSTVFFGSGADGNFDGAIDAADYVVWRKSAGTNGAENAERAIPEPTTLALAAFAMLSIDIATRRASLARFGNGERCHNSLAPR
jgi:hypothetical protein